MKNSLEQSITNDIRESISVKQALLEASSVIAQIEALSQQALESLKNSGKIIFAGNGGSFADSQHLSAEFTSRFMFDRAPLASIALGTNSSAMSAIGNDYGYDQVFSREIAAVGRPEDFFIPISTSGNSPNILSAVNVALKMGVPTVALTGSSGGKLAGICDCICIPSDDTARIQECHILIGHILCGIVERMYFEGSST